MSSTSTEREELEELEELEGSGKEQTLTVTEASRNFSDTVNRAYYRGESTLLMRSGQPVARIVPITNRKNTKNTKKTKLTGGELAKIWKDLPHLDSEEAGLMEKELEEAKKILLPPEPIQWD